MGSNVRLQEEYLINRATPQMSYIAHAKVSALKKTHSETNKVITNTLSCFVPPPVNHRVRKRRDHMFAKVATQTDGRSSVERDDNEK